MDADQDHLNFSFFDGSGLSRVRNCDDAVERMKKSLAADVLDLEQITGDEEKRKGFLESCRFITEEIRNTIRYFEGETGEEVKNLVLTGGICEVEGVAKSTYRAARPGGEENFHRAARPQGLSFFRKGVRSRTLRRLLRQGQEDST